MEKEKTIPNENKESRTVKIQFCKVIDTCRECPFLHPEERISDVKTEYFVCTAADKDIVANIYDKIPVPEWCPFRKEDFEPWQRSLAREIGLSPEQALWSKLAYSCEGVCADLHDNSIYFFRYEDYSDNFTKTKVQDWDGLIEALKLLWKIRNLYPRNWADMINLLTILAIFCKKDGVPFTDKGVKLCQALVVCLKKKDTFFDSEVAELIGWLTDNGFDIWRGLSCENNT